MPEATFRPVVPQNLVAVEGMLDDGDRPTLLAKNSISRGFLQTTTSLASKELISKGTFLRTGHQDPYWFLSLSVLRLAPLHPFILTMPLSE